MKIKTCLGILLLSQVAQAQQPSVEFLDVFSPEAGLGEPVTYAVKSVPGGSILAIGWVDFGNSRLDWLSRQIFQNGPALQFQSPPTAGDGIKQARDFITVREGSSLAIYVVGQNTDRIEAGLQFKRSIVSKSIDGGRTWQQVDEFFDPDLRFSGTTDITADLYGNIYYVGHNCSSTPTNNTCAWFVRKSVDQGRTWKTIDLLPTDQIPFWEPQQIEITPLGEIVIVGFLRTSPTSGYSGLVRVSDQLQETWTNVDLFREPSSKNTAYWSLALGKNGSAFAVSMSDFGDLTFGHVRVSSGVRKDWMDSDVFRPYGNQLPTSPRTVRSSPNGNMYASWRVQKPEGRQFFLRVLCSGSSAWKTWAEFSPGAPLWGIQDFEVPGEGRVIFTGPYKENANSLSAAVIGKIEGADPCSR
jgi:hypothetical protein